MGSLAGRVGGIIYPYVIYLSKVESPIANKLPLLVFGVLSMVGGFTGKLSFIYIHISLCRNYENKYVSKLLTRQVLDLQIILSMHDYH